MLCEPSPTIAESAYFDHAALTPLRPEALAAMVELAGRVGNASSVHSVGRTSRCHLEEARESIADNLGARPSEVVFVGSGTEADNLAVTGTALARPQRRILLSAVEHHSVSDTSQWLVEQQGCLRDVIPVDSTGKVQVEAVKERLTEGEDILLLAVMAANNEVGTVQPIAQLAEVAAEQGVPFHVDAVQAVAHYPMSFTHPGITTMSLASQKFGGPTGVGALLVRRDAEVKPLLHGGGQERGLRAGTHNVVGIVGMAAALRVAMAEQETEAARLCGLRRELIEGLRRVVPEVVVNGAEVATPDGGSPALPGLVSVTFPHCEGESMLMLLDGQGVSVSLGAACSAGVAQPSEVLLAMGLSEERARETIRLSMGYSTTREHVETLCAVLPEVVRRARLAKLA